jgi:hypothetical protein
LETWRYSTRKRTNGRSGNCCARARISPPLEVEACSLKEMKRFFQTIFVVIALGCSNAAAEEFSVGLSLESFALTNPSLRIPDTGGIGYFGVASDLNWDFDSATSGPGIRAKIRIGIILVVGVDLDAYYRFSVDSFGDNLYVGAGVGLRGGIFNDFISFADAHVIVGFDGPFSALTDNSQYFVEFQFGQIISGQESKFGQNTFSPGSGSVRSLSGAFIMNFGIGIRGILR